MTHADLALPSCLGPPKKSNALMIDSLVRHGRELVGAREVGVRAESEPRCSSEAQEQRRHRAMMRDGWGKLTWRLDIG